MTATTPAPGEPLEIAFRNLRENPADMSRWLAVEVLLADPDALEDDDLVDRLCALQDRMEKQARATYGLAEPVIVPGWADAGMRSRQQPA